MRKIILIMLVCILVLNNSVTAVDMELMDKEVLSEMSDAALMDFVEEADCPAGTYYRYGRLS